MTSDLDLANGRCVDWLDYDYWKEYGHFSWEDRCPYRVGHIGPLEVLQSIRGSSSHYIAMDHNPYADERIIKFLGAINRLNVKFEDWTSARVFFPQPGDISLPFHYFFFGTAKDMMTIKMILEP